MADWFEQPGGSCHRGFRRRVRLIPAAARRRAGDRGHPGAGALRVADDGDSRAGAPDGDRHRPSGRPAGSTERRCSTDGHRRTRPPWGQPHRGRAHRADEWQRRGHRRPSARERCRRGPDFVSTGSGTWHTVAGTTPVRGTGGQAYTYTIEVEDGLQSADADHAFAAAVDATLADPRSWVGGGQVTLQRVDSGDPSFRISLTSQMTVRSPAPVMMQQSWSTANDDLTVLNPQLIPADGKVCLPNPYPFPDAAPASAASAPARCASPRGPASCGGPLPEARRGRRRPITQVCARAHHPTGAARRVRSRSLVTAAGCRPRCRCRVRTRPRRFAARRPGSSPPRPGVAA